MKHEPVRFRRWGFLFLVAALAGTAAVCGEQQQGVTGVEIRSDKGGNGRGGGPKGDGSTDGDPTVESTDPSSAPQDTTLEVTVSGSNFDKGSRVDMELDGETTEKVKTNSTRFVNSKKLVADITIAADAVPDLYDVAVTTSKGKRGIGIELFEVVIQSPSRPPPDGFAALSGGYTTTAGDIPVAISASVNGAKAAVSFLETAVRTISFENVPNGTDAAEMEAWCRGHARPDGDADFVKLSGTEMLEFWNEVFIRGATYNYFAKVNLGKDREDNGEPHSEHRTHGAFWTEENGETIRWNYRVGDNLLWPEGPLAIGTVEFFDGPDGKDPQRITITEGVIGFSRTNQDTGAKIRVACRNDQAVIDGVSNPFARDFVSTIVERL